MAKPKTDEVPHGVDLLSAHLCDIKLVLEKIAEQAEERNVLLRSATEGGAARDTEAVKAIRDVADNDNVLARLEALESSIPSRLDEIVAAVISIPGLIAKVDARVSKLEGGTRLPRVEVVAAAKAIDPSKIADVDRGEPYIVSEPVEAPKRRGRKPDPAKCPHPEFETLANDLRRCLRCGAVLPAEVKALPGAQHVATLEGKAPAKVAVLDETHVVVAQADAPPVVIEVKKVAPAASRDTVYKNIDGKLVEVDPDTLEPVVKAEPQPEAPPKAKVVEAVPEAPVTIDDVRAVAIGYAQKHGKDELGAMLTKFGGVQLSLIDPKSYPALLAELSNGA